MKLAIIGGHGMLGRAVFDAANRRDDVKADPFGKAEMDLGTPATLWATLGTGYDAVINCAGTVGAGGIRLYDGGLSTPGVPLQELILVNSLGPAILADVCEATDTRLVHVSTDCVFSGRRLAWQRYERHEPPDPIDAYGKAKALAELIAPRACVVRTSFIGKLHGLWKWASEQHGEIDGWANAMWSGSTVDQVADRLVELAFEAPVGVHHLATANSVSKSEVLIHLKRACGYDYEVVQRIAPVIARGLVPSLAPLPHIESSIMTALLREVAADD